MSIFIYVIDNRDYKNIRYIYIFSQAVANDAKGGGPS